ncbi:MAG: sugar ABC transporter permease [Oscillospiraceae bacterium]|nr:sugar ABC transporter permease [Oscillospiraceae bacterium]
MANQSVVASDTLLKRNPVQRFLITFKKNWQLHLMIVLPLVYMLLFHYWPMYGLQIAFRDYSSADGITGSPWVGLAFFEKFFANNNWSRYVWNTFRISMYSLAASFPVPVILALTLHVNENKALKKIAQNVSYIPHFISTVVMVSILKQVLSPMTGFYGVLCKWLEVSPIDLFGTAEAFDHLYVWSGVWQNMGWNAIIYISALSAVSPDLHEAARIDGASRWKRVLYVDIPAILPTICIMLIMRMGHVLSVGYEKIYLMQNDLNLQVSEVISTFVFREGLSKSNFSFGAAVGLMNSVINTCMVFLVNWITNKLSDGEAGLF